MFVVLKLTIQCRAPQHLVDLAISHLSRNNLEAILLFCLVQFVICKVMVIHLNMWKISVPLKQIARQQHVENLY